MAAMPMGVAGALRAAANAVWRGRAPSRRVQLENDGGANVAAKYEGKGESP
jgi:hypothetical protein